MKTLLFLLLVLIAPLVQAREWTLEEKALLQREMEAQHDFREYDFRVYTFARRADAEVCRANAWNCGLEQGSHVQGFSGVLLVEVSPAWRALLRGLAPGRVSPLQQSADGKAWYFLALSDARDTRRVPVLRDWFKNDAERAMPSVAELRGNPAYRIGYRLAQVRTVDQLQNVVRELKLTARDLDRPLPQGLTLLSVAIVQDDRALFDALLARGASVRACGTYSCPLGDALLFERVDMARELIERGARVDTDPGGPPLFQSALLGDRALTELLLARGADPLADYVVPAASGLSPRGLPDMARNAEPDYRDWLQTVYSTALSTRATFVWDGWIEQGGRRVDLRPGATVALQRAPFALVVRVPQNTRLRVPVFACEGPGLTALLQDADWRTEVLSPQRAGAVDDAPDYLFVAPAADDNACEEESMLYLLTGTPDGVRARPRRAGGGKVEYVYTVNHVVQDGESVALDAYAGRGFSLLVGTAPVVDAGGDFARPVVVRIQF